MTSPSVGIFWGVPVDGGGIVLLADMSPVDRAEEYGDCITHTPGHAEVWERLARLGAAGLEKRGLPTAPAWQPYDAVARGRVVYWPNAGKFIIYADPRLQTVAFVARIVAEFDLPAARCEVKSDPHYRPVPDLS